MHRLHRHGLVVLILWGCQQPLPPTEPVATRLHAVDAHDFQRLWDSCQEVLREHRFAIDRRDSRAGVITTFPETSQQFFEFWRHDVDTAYDLAEASLHTIRRRVTVQIDRGAAPGDYDLAVTVHKERQQRPERQINNAAAAVRVFGSTVPTTAGTRPPPEDERSWIDDGRDGAMEQRLLGLIQQRCHPQPSG